MPVPEHSQFDPSISKLFPAVVGAFVSLRYMRGTRFERATMAMGGAACSYYATTPVVGWLGMLPAEGAVGFVGFFIGLFGMAIISKVFEVLQALNAQQMASDVWDAVKRRMGG